MVWGKRNVKSLAESAAVIWDGSIALLKQAPYRYLLKDLRAVDPYAS